jgi:hypothetical protein
MTDRVTWEPCPRCGEPAAVGWTGEVVAEFDCRHGCAVTEEQLMQLQRRRSPGERPHRNGD